MLLLTSVRDWLGKTSKHGRPRHSAKRAGLKVERLEDRTVLSPVLIQDLNTHTLDSNPRDFLSIGNTTYFIADDSVYGTGIWKTDGTTLTLVVTSVTAELPADLTNVNGTIYFSAIDPTHGRELWKYDGTTASLVADINPGPFDSNPTELTNVNGTLYFAANDGAHGDELWKYDGATASMVADINPYVFGSGPHDLVNINGTLFFGEQDGSGDHLYVKDSTSAHKVANLNGVEFLTNFNGMVFFTADDGTHGRELWKSDGTVTSPVTDINPGAGSSNPYDLTVFNSALYFGADDGTHGNELWKTAGTTYSLVSPVAPDAFDNIAIVGNTLFFAGTDATHGDELWKTDGATTTLVADIYPGFGSSYPSSLTNVNGTLYFAADDGTHGRELWKSDGSSATLVADIFPGTLDSVPNSSFPNNLVNINGTLFFAANDGFHGNELWTSDGTTAGTRLFRDINTDTAGSNPRFMANLNGSIFFSADDGVHGNELWKTDGSNTMLFDLNPGPDGSSPHEGITLNGQLYFTAYDNTHFSQLWKCDGATASIVSIAGGISTIPRYLTVSNGWLHFSADDGVHGRELWKTDGTTTSLVADINPTGDSNPRNLIDVSGKLYFVATDGTHGYHLWMTDGTTTTMTTANFDNFYSFSSFVVVNGTFFFAANDGVTGSELWKTDGTTTSLVADTNPGATGSNPQYLTAANGLVFFVADDGTHGQELWESNGTTTSLVADINSGAASSSPILLTNVNNTLFFEAYDPTDGSGLWKTTGSGVTLVGSYGPTALTEINGMLYFEALQGPQPGSMYKTDGTTTTLVSDFTGLTVQDTFVNVNNTLYFDASDVAHGFEPWKLSLDQSSQLHLSVTPISGVAGSSFSVTVTAEDASSQTITNYNGTVHFTSSDSQAILPGDYTFTAADAGVHTFSVTLKTAGTPTVTATDTLSNSITGSVPVTVTPAAAASLVFSGFPSPTVAGVLHSFTVTAIDSYGNTATSYRGKVHFTSTDSKAILPGTYTFLAGDNGVHSFSATLKTAGMQSLTATDTVTSSITGGFTVQVNAAAASHFTVSGFPSPSTAGVGGNLTVTAFDAFGNLATAYAGTVHFTSSDGKAALPGNYTFTSADMGTHTFSATLKTAGSQSLTAHDTVAGSVVGSQSGIVITPAATAKFKVAGPTTVTAGTAFNITVTAQDTFGNTTPGYTGTVHFTSNDAGATLPSDYTFINHDAGIHLFTSGVTLITGGTRTVSATDIATSSITGKSAGISVGAAALDHFKLVAPISTTAGKSFTLTVTAQDIYNNTVATYQGTVHFTSSDVQAVLPADFNFVTANHGVHLFSVTMKTAGNQIVTVTDIATSHSGNTSVTVKAAAASTLRVSAPASVSAGTAFSFTITALDAFGNLATSYLGAVHFSSSDTRAVLPPNYTFTAADAGMHTFTNAATLYTVGTQSLTATDTKYPTITGSDPAIQVASASFGPMPDERIIYSEEDTDVTDVVEDVQDSLQFAEGGENNTPGFELAGLAWDQDYALSVDQPDTGGLVSIAALLGLTLGSQFDESDARRRRLESRLES